MICGIFGATTAIRTLFQCNSLLSESELSSSQACVIENRQQKDNKARKEQMETGLVFVCKFFWLFATIRIQLQTAYIS